MTDMLAEIEARVDAAEQRSALAEEVVLPTGLLKEWLVQDRWLIARIREIESELRINDGLFEKIEDYLEQQEPDTEGEEGQ